MNHCVGSPQTPKKGSLKMTARKRIKFIKGRRPTRSRIKTASKKRIDTNADRAGDSFVDFLTRIEELRKASVYDVPDGCVLRRERPKRGAKTPALKIHPRPARRRSSVPSGAVSRGRHARPLPIGPAVEILGRSWPDPRCSG